MIRHHVRTACAVALTLALTLIAASPASATPWGGYGPGLSQPAATPTSTPLRSKIADTGPCSEVCSGGGFGRRVSRPAATPLSTRPASDVSSTNGYDFARVPPSVVRIISRDSGFDWGDAGIGAAGGLALAMLGVGGGLAISRQRLRRAHHTTTLPN